MPSTEKVSPGATTGSRGYGILSAMSREKVGKHFIRKWRKARGLSLRQLADRLESEPGGDPIVSYASLSRIENGEQPFSEPILNAIADALDVSRSSLLEIDPTTEGQVIDLLRRMDDRARERALELLQVLAKPA